MKKTLPLALCYLLNMCLLHSQGISWDWARCTTNNSNSQEGFDVTTDSSANAYITGIFYSATTTFGSYTLTSGGTANCYVAKYSPTGDVLWATCPTIGPNDLVWSIHIATDARANIYITGYYTGTGVTFANTTLPPIAQNGSNLFTAKYDSLGNFIWIQTAGSSSYTKGTGISTDDMGHIYVCGSFEGSTLTFGTTTLTNHGYVNYNHDAVFIVKYDTTGNVLWAQAPGASINNQPDVATGVATDLSGNVYLTGRYDADSINFGNVMLHNVGSENIFLAKYNGTGQVLWAKSAGYQDDAPYGIITDGDSHVYITGEFSANYTLFDNITLNSINPGGRPTSLFLTQYDSDGNVQWAKTAGSFFGTRGFGLSTDACRNVYCTIGFLANDNVATLVFDSSSYSLSGNVSDPLALVEFSPGGSLLNCVLLGSGGDDQSGLHIDNTGHGYVVSDIEQVNPFIVGNDTLILSGGETIYTARFTCPPSQPDTLSYYVSPPSICQGDLAIITFSNGSGINISPANNVSWINNNQAWLSADTTTAFTFNAYQGCGITGQDTVVLPVFFPRAIVAYTNTPNLCPGDTAQICVPAGFSNYQWSTGDTLPCIYTHTAGTYTATVTDNGLCSATSTQVIVSFSTAPFSVTQNSDTLSYNFGSSYQWQLNGAAIMGATSSNYVANAAGTYTLQIIDSNGCPVTSDPLIISGINDLTNAGISLYPNPSSGSFVLTVDNILLGSEADVFDAEGRQIFKTQIKAPKTEISFNALRGVYTLKVNAPGIMLVRKVVKL